MATADPKRSNGKHAESDAGPLAHLAGAASMATAALLVNRLHNAPPVIEVPEPEGLRPFEPEGVLATVATKQPRLHFPLSVLQRFTKTRCGMHSGVVAFAGFVSIFPLLIAFTAALDIILADRPDLRDKLIDTALGSIPVIGDDLQVGSTKGSGLVLVVGVLGALWAALAAMNALQTAIDDVWQLDDRPNFALARLRSLGALVVVGLSLVGSTALVGIATTSDLPLSSVWGSAAGLGINVLGVATSQVVLCPSIRFRDAWTGAIISGVGLTALQIAGGLLVNRYLVGASNTYGTFATVIALTAWFGLNAQAVLFGVAWNAERRARSPRP